MAKYDDHKTAGRSEVVPFIEGESTDGRHARRLHDNYGLRGVVEKWCQENNAALRIQNHNQHWIVTSGDLIAEYWPSTAKCVINKQWKRGVHVHDVHQFIGVIERHIGGHR